MEKIISQIARKASFSSIVILGLGFLGFANNAKAVIILPGQALATTGVTAFGGSLVADTGMIPFTGVDTFNNVVFTGDLDTQVYADTGGLDFVYQFSNNANSLDSIQRLTASGYTGYTTDADYIAGTGASGPFLVSRSTGAGDTIGFSFLAGLPVLPGTTSDTIVIRTDATNFVPSTASLSDGGNANAPSFSPVTVPEPASIAVAAFGFSTLTLRRRKNKA